MIGYHQQLQAVHKIANKNTSHKIRSSLLRI